MISSLVPQGTSMSFQDSFLNLTFNNNILSLCVFFKESCEMNLNGDRYQGCRYFMFLETEKCVAIWVKKSTLKPIKKFAGWGNNLTP